MTNLDKMNELKGTRATKEQICSWAYQNRISVAVLSFEEGFEELEGSVNHFMESTDYWGLDAEHTRWELFLDAEYVSQ